MCIRDRTRAATAYLIDTVQSFDELKVAVKRKESELGLLSQPSAASLHSMQAAEIAQLTSQLEQMRAEINHLRNERETASYTPAPGRANYSHNRSNQPISRPPSQQPPMRPTREPVTCYRCGQQGHVKRGCRNPPLNGSGSAQRPNRRS